MDHHFRFARLWVDLDITGGPVGLGYEVYDDDGRAALVVLEEPPPFETGIEAFARLLKDYLSAKGEQLTLFDL